MQLNCFYKIFCKVLIFLTLFGNSTIILELIELTLSNHYNNVKGQIINKGRSDIGFINCIFSVLHIDEFT